MKPYGLFCSLCLAIGMGWGQEKFPCPEGRAWPQKVGIHVAPVVTAVEFPQATQAELPSRAGKWFAYQTDHFQMLCDQSLAPTALRELGRLLEATWQLNCVLPLNWQPTVPNGQKYFTVRIFAKSADYHAAKGPVGTGGVYLADRQEVLIPSRSLGADVNRTKMTVERQTEDQGTLVHEVTHLMMHAWLANLPIWLAEGSAEYVSAADYSGGEFRLKNQLAHVKERLERRLGEPAKNGRATGSKTLTVMPLQAFLKMDAKEWKKQMGAGKAAILYGTALALTSYFYHGDGAVPAEMPVFGFVDEIRRGIPFSRPLETLLMRNRTAAKLEESVSRFWQSNGVKLSFAPSSDSAFTTE